MSEKKEKKLSLTSWKMILLLAYFPILTAERAISLVNCFSGDRNALDALDIYMMILTMLSTVGAYAFIALKCKPVLKLSDYTDASSPALSDGSFSRLSIAVGILLLGGMVHTNGTIPPIQFASYGMILGSMAIHTVQKIKQTKNSDRKWLTFAYISAYSMSIPVVYHTKIELSYLFIPIECVVSAGMVLMFTIMLAQFYSSDGEEDFSLLPFLTALAGDFAVLLLRWEEEVNAFVLIFLCIMTILWFAGNVMRIRRRKKRK